MSDYNQNQNPDDFIEEIEGNDQAKEVGKSGAKYLSKQAGKKIGQVVAQLGKKALAMAGKAIVSALATIAPYLAIILGIILVIVAGYYILFETRGAESRYTFANDSENPLKYNADGGYFSTRVVGSDKTNAVNLNNKSKAIMEFYKYFGERAFFQIIPNDKGEYDPTKLEFTEGADQVRDYYKKENLYTMNPNFLFVLDEYLYKNNFRYPEQFVKPVQYDPKSLELVPLTDEEGLVTAESFDYDEEGNKTDKKVKSVHDYGLASIFKYKKEKRTLTVEGTFYKKEVGSGNGKTTVTINEPFNEVMDEYPQDIWLMDKAITFVGEYTFFYEIKKTIFDELKDGVGDLNSDKIKYHYDDYTYCTGANPPTCKTIPLYKYKKGYVYETMPRPVPSKNIENKKGDRYLKDYLRHFQAWVPMSVMKSFDFHQRVGKILDTDLEVGNLADKDKNDKFAGAYQWFDIIQKYSEMYGVDPYVILAMMSQESGGNPYVNDDGLMQIVDFGTVREVKARNIKSGSMDTFSIQPGKADRQDPEKAIRFAVMLFAYKQNNFDGDMLKALQSYNIDPSKIKDWYPNDWNTLNWMNHREELREYHGRRELGKSTRSASYDCMPDFSKPSNLSVYGDVCYVEHVMRFYAGHALDGLEGHDKDQVSVGDQLLAGLLSIFKYDYEEEEAKRFYEHHMGGLEIDWTLRSITTFSQNIVFSEVENAKDIPFWDSNFSSSSGSLTADEFLDAVPGADGYISPLNYENPAITSQFGNRDRPIGDGQEFHRGIDIAMPIGTPLYAIADGVVENAGPASGFGLWIVIRLDDGNKTVYGHIDAISDGLKPGVRVKQGQLVAFSGNRGESTGPHLHFEFYKGNKEMDPTPIVMRTVGLK